MAKKWNTLSFNQKGISFQKGDFSFYFEGKIGPSKEKLLSDEYPREMFFNSIYVFMLKMHWKDPICLSKDCCTKFRHFCLLPFFCYPRSYWAAIFSWRNPTFPLSYMCFWFEYDVWFPNHGGLSDRTPKKCLAHFIKDTFSFPGRAQPWNWMSRPRTHDLKIWCLWSQYFHILINTFRHCNKMGENRHMAGVLFVTKYQDLSSIIESIPKMWRLNNKELNIKRSSQHLIKQKHSF